jgi:hypothetical protein
MGGNALTVTATSVEDTSKSGTATVNVTVPAPDVTVTGTTANSVSLSWAGVSDAGGYRVRRGNSSSTIGNPPIVSLGPGVTSYTDTGLSPGTQYWYEVEAYAGSNGSGSAPVSATTTSGGSPAATLTVSGLGDAIGMYCQAALLATAGFDPDTIFDSEPSNMSLSVEITAATMALAIYDNAYKSGVWTATPGGTYMAVFIVGSSDSPSDSLSIVGYKQITLTGTHGAFDATTLAFIAIPGIPEMINVGDLIPNTFGLTYTESVSDTYIDGDGTHSYTHYKLTDTGSTRFTNALTAIANVFGNDGDGGYSVRNGSSITDTSDWLLLEVIDHPPAGIGGSDEVRLIESAGYTKVNSRGWHQN